MEQDSLIRLFNSHKSRFNLRMAPMIDMVFLLLIFFLVTSNFRPQQAFLPLRLPTAQAGTLSIKPQPLLIHLAATGQGCEVTVGPLSAVQINGDNLEQNFATLASELRRCLTAQRRIASDPIRITCEPDVEWDYLAKIYNLLYGCGLTDLTFQLID